MRKADQSVWGHVWGLPIKVGVTPGFTGNPGNTGDYSDCASIWKLFGFASGFILLLP